MKTNQILQSRIKNFNLIPSCKRLYWSKTWFAQTTEIGILCFHSARWLGFVSCISGPSYSSRTVIVHVFFLITIVAIQFYAKGFHISSKIQNFSISLMHDHDCSPRLQEILLNLCARVHCFQLFSFLLLWEFVHFESDALGWNYFFCILKKAWLRQLLKIHG